MDGDFSLDIGERSFEGIRGIGDVEMRELFAGEKPWKIRLETSVRTSQTFVREMPTLRDGIDSFLNEKLSPFLIPELEPVTEACFIGLR